MLLLALNMNSSWLNPAQKSIISKGTSMSIVKNSKFGAVLAIASMICASNGWAQMATQKSAQKIQPLPKLSVNLQTMAAKGSMPLNCGTTYYGTLDVSNSSGITIETQGDCGRAVITPAVPVTDWQPYNGNIYVANVVNEVTQVFVDDQLVGVAHYPNSLKETGWIQPTSVTETSIEVSGLPNNDIVGARATYRGPHPWAIGTRTITAYDGVSMTLPAPSTNDLKSEDSLLGKFYLEGKLWMLDSPGEWAWSNGKLYLWMPDGQAPGDRVRATPNTVNAVINARGSTNLTVKNVRIVGGRIGIDGGFSEKMNRSSLRLQITSSEIAYSDWVGIYASNAESMAVDGSEIFGALHTGIYARTGSAGTVIRNSRFTNINTIGMHKGSDGSIFLNSDSKAVIFNNTITNSGKSGIYIGESKNSLVKKNVVDGACRIHGDCGGIYLFDRKKVPLNTRVESNLVKNVNGDPARPNSQNPERYAIYLDDYTTGATIIANTISNNDTGMQLHFAFNNEITSNLFADNVQRHVLLSEKVEGRAMQNNVFNNNAFQGPSLVYFFAVPDPKSAATFGVNNYNLVTAGTMVDPSNVPIK
jgi:parallel beta-helix repeat protein